MTTAVDRAAKLRARIATEVATWPPLTAEQRVSIAAALDPPSPSGDSERTR